MFSCVGQQNSVWKRISLGTDCKHNLGLLLLHCKGVPNTKALAVLLVVWHESKKAFHLQLESSLSKLWMLSRSVQPLEAIFMCQGKYTSSMLRTVFSEDQPFEIKHIPCGIIYLSPLKSLWKLIISNTENKKCQGWISEKYVLMPDPWFLLQPHMISFCWFDHVCHDFGQSSGQWPFFCASLFMASSSLLTKVSPSVLCSFSKLWPRTTSLDLEEKGNKTKAWPDKNFPWKRSSWRNESWHQNEFSCTLYNNLKEKCWIIHTSAQTQIACAAQGNV